MSLITDDVPDLFEDVIDSRRGPRRQDLVHRVDRALASLNALMRRPPCVIFIGDSNSGKTTAANRLLGGGLLPTSVVVNTRYPTLVRFAETVELHAHMKSGRRERVTLEDVPPAESIELLEVRLPNPRLRQFEVLDTPGHLPPAVALDLPGLPSLRIPVWCTLATQAWKESERRAWMAVDAKLRRHAVLAVTSCDRIHEASDKERLFNRLRADAGSYFQRVVSTSSVEEHGQTQTLSQTIDLVAPAIADRRRRASAKIAQRLVRLSSDPASRQALPPALLSAMHMPDDARNSERLVHE